VARSVYGNRPGHSRRGAIDSKPGDQAATEGKLVPSRANRAVIGVQVAALRPKALVVWRVQRATMGARRKKLRRWTMGSPAADFSAAG